MTASPARGRLAPSPTGRLHLGNAFAFLAAWLSIRAQAGALVLRLEDIDPERSKPAFAEGIYEDLAWLGLDWDEGPGGERRGKKPEPAADDGAAPAVPEKAGNAEGPFAPYAQSGRLHRYEAAIAALADLGLVYQCYCTRKELRMLASAPHAGDEGMPYPGRCRRLTDKQRAAHESVGRRPSLRLNTEKAMNLLERRHGGALPEFLSINDGVLGAQNFIMPQSAGDFPLRRSDGVFAYQLAVVVDDAAMHITEVLRGGDLLLSTPRQALLFHLLGHAVPRYAHLPLLHDAGGERLAKRHKSLELAALRGAGIRPQQITGWLAHLAGWLQRPESLTPEDLIPYFSLDSLRGRQMRLPKNIIDTLRKV